MKRTLLSIAVFLAFFAPMAAVFYAPMYWDLQLRGSIYFYSGWLGFLLLTVALIFLVREDIEAVVAAEKAHVQTKYAEDYKVIEGERAAERDASAGRRTSSIPNVPTND